MMWALRLLMIVTYLRIQYLKYHWISMMQVDARKYFFKPSLVTNDVDTTTYLVCKLFMEFIFQLSLQINNSRKCMRLFIYELKYLPYPRISRACCRHSVPGQSMTQATSQLGTRRCAEPCWIIVLTWNHRNNYSSTALTRTNTPSQALKCLSLGELGRSSFYLIKA